MHYSSCCFVLFQLRMFVKEKTTSLEELTFSCYYQISLFIWTENLKLQFFLFRENLSIEIKTRSSIQGYLSIAV